jgi:predicted phosphoribosyltransferase
MHDTRALQAYTAIFQHTERYTELSPNRADAGRKLAKALAGYKDEQPVLLALPRGGVSVAAEVAAVLKAPLDLILVRKIGVPIQPELAMGAVVDGVAPIIVRNHV